MGAQLSNTELAVQELCTEICKLSEKVENTHKPSYAAAAAAGAGITQAQNRNITTKAVPTRHKREITVTGGNLNPAQVRRTNKETIEQACWWRLKAEEVRTQAEAFSSAEARDTMKTVAETWDLRRLEPPTRRGGKSAGAALWQLGLRH